MKIFIPVFVVILVLCSCSPEENGSELIGQWRSNKQLTLASIEKSSKMTEAVRSAMTGPSFGNEIWEFKRNKSRFMVIDSGENWNFVKPFQKYEILRENEEFFLIEAHGIYSKAYKQKLFREGNCFYEFYERTDVKNYFCKI